MAFVAYSDNILTGRAFANRNRYEVDSKRELLALGAANLASGVMQGFPVSSSGSRTAIGDALGGRSQLYSLVALATVVVTVLFLRPLLAAFPTAALGAVVVYAAMRLVDIAEFRGSRGSGAASSSSPSPPRSACWCSACSTACWSPSGCRSSTCCGGWRGPTTDPRLRARRRRDARRRRLPGRAAGPGLVVYRYDSPLFFANVEDFSGGRWPRSTAPARRRSGSCSTPRPTSQVDITAMDALEELRKELTGRGIVFAMARVKQELRDDLRACGFVERIGEDRIFMTLPTAVQAYVRWYVDEHGAPPANAPPPT